MNHDYYFLFCQGKKIYRSICKRKENKIKKTDFQFSIKDDIMFLRAFTSLDIKYVA